MSSTLYLNEGEESPQNIPTRKPLVLDLSNQTSQSNMAQEEELHSPQRPLILNLSTEATELTSTRLSTKPLVLSLPEEAMEPEEEPTLYLNQNEAPALKIRKPLDLNQTFDPRLLQEKLASPRKPLILNLPSNDTESSSTTFSTKSLRIQLSKEEEEEEPTLYLNQGEVNVKKPLVLNLLDEKPQLLE